MKKKFIFNAFAFVIVSLFFFSTTVLAKPVLKTIKAYLNTITLSYNGKSIGISTIKYNNVTYVPLNKVTDLLNKKVITTSKGFEILDKSNIPNGSKVTSLPASITIKDVKVTITKVEQDSKALKIYVAYTNNSPERIDPAESLVKVISNGRQYEYDLSFVLDYMDKYRDEYTSYPHAPSEIEPGVIADSVILLPPIPNIEKNVRIILRANYEYYTFLNVPVTIN
ncbi:hypothetical protein [Carboxydothermus pertinax]|uniref:Copper amine oxidase-like N-terminal domain-containing protein n=1 Tax=Carboxydothermus pertinax TaxID=870242 RepID=A0A1L8CRP1_9THEO|nr:hypothetical protein [Carboxydothermus pertinax]GAV21567.1 hypothetical protein cpu_00770 [Carboxydothermus pertinax]